MTAPFFWRRAHYRLLFGRLGIGWQPRIKRGNTMEYTRPKRLYSKLVRIANHMATREAGIHQAILLSSGTIMKGDDRFRRQYAIWQTDANHYDDRHRGLTVTRNTLPPAGGSPNA